MTSVRLFSWAKRYGDESSRMRERRGSVELMTDQMFLVLFSSAGHHIGAVIRG